VELVKDGWEYLAIGVRVPTPLDHPTVNLNPRPTDGQTDRETDRRMNKTAIRDALVISQ